MTTKPRTRTVQTIDNAENLGSLVSSIDEFELDDGIDPITQLLDSFGGGDDKGKVTVRKYNPETKDMEWVASMTGDEWLASEYEGIAREHGGGKYDFYIYGPDKKIAGRRSQTIAASVKPKPVASGESSELRGFIESQNEFMKNLGAMFAASLQNHAPAVPVQSRREMLDEMLLYRQIFAPVSGTNREPVNPIEMFKSVAEVIRDISPPDGDPPLMSQITKLMETFGPHIESAMKSAQNQSGVPGQAAIPPQAIVRKLAPGAQLGDNAEMFEKQLINRYLNLFIESAENDEDPAPYASMVVAKVPAHILNEWVSKPSLTDELKKFNPAVSRYRLWFDEMRGLILEMLAEIAAEENAETVQNPNPNQALKSETETETKPKPGPKSVPEPLIIDVKPERSKK